MIALGLVRRIETHSEKIAKHLAAEIHRSPLTSDMQRIPEPELFAGIRDLVQHLRDWLLTKTDADIERRYRRIGAHWASQEVALTHACWAVIMTKEYLWEFLQKQGLLPSPVELYGEVEVLWLLDHFFDRALCSVIEGYRTFEGIEAQPRRSSEGADVNLANWVP